MFLELLTEVLKAAGYDDVLTSHSAEDALALVSATSEHIDTFLLDIRMPGMDGIALCREIRNSPSHSHTPILMLTAVKDLDSIDRAFSAGATDYVTKPLNGLELGTRINLARMLSSQLRLAAQKTHDLISVENELNRKRGIYFEDAFEVEGTIAYLELENYLLKLAPAFYEMRIFGLKIMDVEAIFEETSIDDFSRFLDEVSRQINLHYASRKLLLTYAGRGVFGCVLMDRESPESRSLERVGGETRLSLDVQVKDGSKARIHLIKGTSPSPHLWTAASAASALAKAIGKADERCIDEVLQQRLDVEKLDSESLIPRRITSRNTARKVSERLG